MPKKTQLWAPSTTCGCEFVMEFEDAQGWDDPALAVVEKTTRASDGSTVYTRTCLAHAMIPTGKRAFTAVWTEQKKVAPVMQHIFENYADLVRAANPENAQDREVNPNLVSISFIGTGEERQIVFSIKSLPAGRKTAIQQFLNQRGLAPTVSVVGV